MLANDVVYYVDELRGRAYDAQTGATLWESPVAPGASIGSAAAVAGNHVLMNHYGVITAYRLS